MKGYREDIDRLRGLAVLAVVAFHFEVPGIYGGFVGVDIFFVISGFLITQIIQREISAGTFCFARFYERRLRRLLPALYAMVAVTILPALYFLLPSERIDFFRSIVATVTFTSNLFFWAQAGYFDRSAVEKPLLHTWSLAVEEQFYLIFPIIIWVLLRTSLARLRFALAAAFASLGIASFVVGEWLLGSGRAPAAFFMSPVRGWEFLIGSIIATTAFPVLGSKFQRFAICGISYVFLLVPIFGLRQISQFPGWNAFFPCFGAALFIWSGTGTAPVERHRLSPYRLARFFGTISYSLYLWHWPMFTFARFAKDGLTLSGLEKTVLFLATVMTAYLSWRFVEQPFRQPLFLRTRRSVFTTAAATSIALMAIGTSWPVSSELQSKNELRIAKLDAYNRFSEDAYRGGSCFTLAEIPIDASCITMRPDQFNVLLWGDSHAAHYYPGLLTFTEGRSVNLMQATAAGCAPTLQPHPKSPNRCKQFSEQMVRWFAVNKPNLVILSGDWMPDVGSSRFPSLVENLKSTIRALNDQGIETALLGPSIQFKTGLPAMIIRAEFKGVIPVSGNMLRADIFEGDAKMKAALPEYDGFRYISVIESVCSTGECPITVEGDVPLVWDYGHLTVEGSRYVVSKLAWPNLQLGRSAMRQ